VLLPKYGELQELPYVVVLGKYVVGVHEDVDALAVPTPIAATIPTSRVASRYFIGRFIWLCLSLSGC
jgi:hypothetical protein